MKLLWLCNMMPGKIRQAITGNVNAGGLWVDQVLDGLLREQVRVFVLCPGTGDRGQLNDLCTYVTFQPGKPYQYLPQQETLFRETLQQVQPDVVHIWGTEYSHTLAMVNACHQAGLLEHTVISIQGLCSAYTGHYAEGLPGKVYYGRTLRDILRQDSIRQQQKKFALRGKLEVEALQKAKHVIGRTDWDRACTQAINPELTYHFCNETLREDFYQGQWQYAQCRKHRIFASSCAYPIKGFHYLLEAFRQVLRQYPDATLAVPGKNVLEIPAYRLEGYQKYLKRLILAYDLSDKVTFLGNLSAEQMKQEFLQANVFVLPSTVENSPNSLGEAMVLGVPCVASDVGGVAQLLKGGGEGYVYPSTAPYLLAYDIQQVFKKEEQAEKMGSAASTHALETHDPEKNLRDLLQIYRSLAR